MAREGFDLQLSVIWEHNVEKGRKVVISCLAGVLSGCKYLCPLISEILPVYIPPAAVGIIHGRVAEYTLGTCWTDSRIQLERGVEGCKMCNQ